MPATQRLPVMATSLILALAALVAVPSVEGVRCFECFDTGPSHANCTQEKACTGAACLTFEDGLNVTSSAFCLLTTEHVALNKVSAGCWLEPDGRARHCVCFSDFCNRLPSVPTHSPPGGLEMLKQNPFLDYEYQEPEDTESTATDRLHARPAPANLLFPSALADDLKVAGDSEEDSRDDLVPIDFDEYTNSQHDFHNESRTEQDHSPASGVDAKCSPCLLAASIVLSLTLFLL